MSTGRSARFAALLASVLAAVALTGCSSGRSGLLVRTDPGGTPGASTRSTIGSTAPGPAPIGGRSATTLGPIMAPTSPPTSASAPAAPWTTVTTPAPTAGAPPRVVAVGVDAATATATLTFDQPVRPTAASIAPLYLVIYGGQAGCRVPQGNGHARVNGNGTGFLALPATSLVQGTNYVTVAPGFATSLSGRPSAALECTAVTSPTAPIAPTTTTLPTDAPTVVSADMDPVAGTVTVTFDRPVAGSQPMYLVVYEGDATCSAPNGNAHSYISGDGTTTVTTNATSLVAGTTYITIASGWVTSTQGPATPNKPLGCTAIHAG